MARNEQDREDLLHEATALVERVELTVDGEPANVVLGFRRDGSGSVYFGADPVYQFNVRNELRRAFIAGRLYKAEQGRLVQLERHRTASETQLIRHDCTAAETEISLTIAQQRLAQLADRLRSGQYRLMGQVPADRDIVTRSQTWLAALPQPLTLAQSPRVE